MKDNAQDLCLTSIHNEPTCGSHPGLACRLAVLTFDVLAVWAGTVKIKRTVNDAVVAANRKNAAKSSGPRTQRGKQIVSGNAEKWEFLQKTFGLRMQKKKTATEHCGKPYRGRAAGKTSLGA
jgi:hypothetical protein